MLLGTTIFLAGRKKHAGNPGQSLSVCPPGQQTAAAGIKAVRHAGWLS